MEKCTLVQALRLCTGCTAHRGSRGVALPFHDDGTRRGWGVSVTPRPLFTPGKDPVPIVQEVGGPKGRSGQLRKISPPPRFDPRTVFYGARRLILRSSGILRHVRRFGSIYRRCLSGQKITLWKLCSTSCLATWISTRTHVNVVFLLWRCDPTPVMASFLRFLDHTQRRITVGRTPLESDQLVAETSTWQHTTLTTDKHPCLRWDSNPRSQ